MNGKVKWFNPRTGYGFITGEDETDYFVHHTSIQTEGFRTLKENADVTFDTDHDDQGRPVAKNVVVA